MRIILPFDRSAKKIAHQKSVGSKCKVTFAALPFIHEGLCVSFQAGSRTSESSVTVAGQCRTLMRFENRTTTGLSPLCAVHPGDQHTQNDWYSIQLVVS